MKTHNAKRFLIGGFLLMMIVVTGGNLTQAQSCTVYWTGNAGTDVWGTAGNWSTNEVPGPTSDVCILKAPSTGSVDTTGTSSISVNSIQVGTGVGLAFGTGQTASIATTLNSQGYLTMFGPTTVSAASVDVQSGSLVGSGTIEGSLTNSGYMAPTAGTFTVTGNYTQTSGGELSLQYWDVAAVYVDQEASLSGTLVVAVNPKHPPKPGSTYTIMTFSSHSGEFTSVSQGFSLEYSNTSIVVVYQ